MDEREQNVNTSKKLTIKLIISIILFFLSIVILCLGIWASQAGKDRFEGYVSVTTTDINACVTAKVTGVRTTSGEGYGSEKLLWDSLTSTDEVSSASWKNIDFTFASKDSIIELEIIVANRKVESGINVNFNARLGDTMLTTAEQVIGDTNIMGYIEDSGFVSNAIDINTPTFSTYRVVLKVADANKSVKTSELDINLILTDPGETENT